MPILAVRATEAAKILGISPRTFRRLEKEGYVIKHSVIGTYPVAMLEELVCSGYPKDRWPMGGETEVWRGPDSGIRTNRNRSRKEPKAKAVGPLDIAYTKYLKNGHST